MSSKGHWVEEPHMDGVFLHWEEEVEDTPKSSTASDYEHACEECLSESEDEERKRFEDIVENYLAPEWREYARIYYLGDGVDYHIPVSFHEALFDAYMRKAKDEKGE